MRLLSANVFIFMQIREHSILFQKDGIDEFAKDLVEDFGMVVTEITPDGASAKVVCFHKNGIVRRARKFL